MYLRITRSHADSASIDAVVQAVPAVLAAIRELPGCLDARTGIDRKSGWSVAVTTWDTLEHAQFAREQLGAPLERLVAAGWRAEAPEIFESLG